MTQEVTQQLEKHIKKTTLLSNAIAVAVAILSTMSLGYAFYYNTTATLKEHSSSIEDVQASQKIMGSRVGSVEIDVSSIKANQSDVKDDVKEIKESVKELIQLMIQNSETQRTLVRNTTHE